VRGGLGCLHAGRAGHAARAPRAGPNHQNAGQPGQHFRNCARQEEARGTRLKKEDFQVFENEQEQKIAFFSSDRALPITLGLLIDTSRSEENRLPAEQEAATRFLNQVLRKGDEAMVIPSGRT